MNPDIALALVRHAMEVTLMLSAPLLLTSLGVGLVISIFQAATQINEATLSFIPKLIAIFLVLVTLGPWMLGVLTDYTREIIENIPVMINGS